MTNKTREALTELVKVWESLLCGYHSQEPIVVWIRELMKKAIDAVRAALAEQPVRTMTRDQVRDLVKDVGLDWHRGFMPLFDGDETNRFEVLVNAALAAQPAQPLTQRAIELMPDTDVFWIWERAATISDKVNELVRIRAAREVVRAVLLAYVEQAVRGKPLAAQSAFDTLPDDYEVN